MMPSASALIIDATSTVMKTVVLLPLGPQCLFSYGCFDLLPYGSPLSNSELCRNVVDPPRASTNVDAAIALPHKGLLEGD